MCTRTHILIILSLVGKNFLGIILSDLIHPASAKSQCPGECCYLYARAPGDFACNPEGEARGLRLQCAIYAPNSTIGYVRWYRTESECSVGISGELISIREFDASSEVPFNSSLYSGLALVRSSLDISNFTSRDNGYYWCEVEVENTCIRPSPSGHVEFKDATHVKNCSSINFTGLNLEPSPVCASGSVKCHYTSRPQISRNTLSSMLVIATATPCDAAMGGRTSVLEYAVIGILVFLMTLLSAALTLLAAVAISHRHTIKTRSNGESCLSW